MVLSLIVFHHDMLDREVPRHQRASSRFEEIAKVLAMAFFPLPIKTLFQDVSNVLIELTLSLLQFIERRCRV